MGPKCARAGSELPMLQGPRRGHFPTPTSEMAMETQGGKNLPEGSSAGFRDELPPPTPAGAEPGAGCCVRPSSSMLGTGSCCLVFSLLNGRFTVGLSRPPPYSRCVLRCVGSEINYPFSPWVSRPHTGTQEPGQCPLEWVAISRTSSPFRSQTRWGFVCLPGGGAGVLCARKRSS